MSDNRPLHEQAYEDYLKGMKYKEIAEKYGVSESTVRSWKSRHWVKQDLPPKSENVATNKESVATENKKRCNEKSRQRGAPQGNKNAIGNTGGAPKGNENNLKHGIYEKLRFENLSSDEQELLVDIDNLDMASELRRTIRECDLNIIKYNRAIKDAEEKQGGLYTHSVFKRAIKNQQPKKEGADATTELKGNAVDVTQIETMTTHDLIIRYGNELQKWQGKRIRCIETLIRYEFETERLILEKKKLEKDAGGDGNLDVLVNSIENARKKRG